MGFSKTEKENFLLRCFVRYIEEEDKAGMESLKEFVPMLNGFDTANSDALAKAITEGNAEEDYMLIAWYDAIGPLCMDDNEMQERLRELRERSVLMSTF